MSKTAQHQAAWKVFGNKRSNRVFTAALPAQQGKAGDRVKLESKAGVVTTGTLSELHSAADGLEYWTVNRDSKTPEQHAADRALRAESQAEYWQSDKASETARKIAERAARKAAAAGSEAPAPEAPATSTSEAAPDSIATTVAMLIAGGMPPADAAAVGLAMKAAQGTSEAPASTSKPRNQNGTRQGSKGSKAGSKGSATHGDCAACKRTDVDLNQHPAGHAVCNYCKSADVETITRRVARKGSK